MPFLLSPFIIMELLVTGLVLAVIMGFLSLAAGAIIRGPPKSVWGLRVSMLTTAVAVVLGGLGLFYAIAYYMGASSGFLYGITGMVAIVMILQWLFSPSIINAVYRTRPPSEREAWLEAVVSELARTAGLKSKPKVLIAEIDAPNAFAYGSPVKGNYVAVTRGLLNLMPKEEIKAVLGHEIGHLKHRDVAAILALSLIPVAIFYLGRTLLAWGWLMGDGRERGGALYYVGLGAVLVAAGALFQFLVTHFNRLREYYADAFGATVVGEPRYLQRALARLTVAYKHDPELSSNINKTAAMLFFVNFLINASGGIAYDPYDYFELDAAWRPRRRKPRRIVIEDIDRVVEELMNQKESPVVELFSSHPPVSKRLKFLENLKMRLSEAMSAN